MLEGGVLNSSDFKDPIPLSFIIFLLGKPLPHAHINRNNSTKEMELWTPGVNRYQTNMGSSLGSQKLLQAEQPHKENFFAAGKEITGNNFQTVTPQARVDGFLVFG